MATHTHHFENKIPGGKLVVVDVTEDDGRITEAVVSGDFFLEPEEAFTALREALVGASVHDDTVALTARLDASLSRLDSPVALHGFSTRDLAITVRRALVGATDMTDHEWEVLPPVRYSAALNVALDQYILEEVAAGRRGPTMRMWDWNGRAVILGSYQSYMNEINDDGVRKHGIDVIRRISGGGAMFVEEGNCVTYSIYAPESVVRGLSYEDSYAYLDRWVLAGLADMGVRAWYVPINDITSDGGKIGGAAQKRVKGAVLHHVTMSYDIDTAKMMDVLRVGKVKLSSKGLRSAAKRVDPLRRQTGASREEILDGLQRVFLSRFPSHVGKLSEEELEAGKALVEEKFDTEQWRHLIP